MARIIDTEAKNMIGKKVKQYRKAMKMSQQELSDKLEVLAIYICVVLFRGLRIRQGLLRILSCGGWHKS